jgi:carbonic anhydrase
MRDLTRRDLIRAASVAAAAVAVGSVQGLAPSAFGAPPAVWTHDPASPIGPPAWGDIGFPTCGMGRSQSPVNISTDAAVDMHGAPLMLRYQTSELAVENTGHVIEVPIPAGVRDTLQIGGDFYTLSQYHFHAPSEHTVDGRQADVEAHFVHTKTRCSTESFSPRRPPRARRSMQARPTPLSCSTAPRASRGHPGEAWSR